MLGKGTYVQAATVNKCARRHDHCIGDIWLVMIIEAHHQLGVAIEDWMKLGLMSVET
ncbi:MAG TPA: hypothetical protein VGO47_13810 [Chlamydiales bacterium]|nr:hypothetical protein [Chlamydiales bacterium]